MSRAGLSPPPSPDGKEVLAPGTRAQWREWLDSHPRRSDGLWVAFVKKTSSLDGPVYEDLVEEALCFGWIDSQARSVDDERRMLWFSPRRRGGFWSASNKARVERLESQGRMTERGRTAIAAAQADGTWSTADDVENLILHPDLQDALAAAPAAREAYERSTASQRKQHLWWIYSAKRSSTRADRIVALIRRLSEAEPPAGR